MSGQFIRSTEAFCASGELANMGLLSSVSANVASLMLKSVEGL